MDTSVGADAPLPAVGVRSPGVLPSEDTRQPQPNNSAIAVDSKSTSASGHHKFDSADV